MLRLDNYNEFRLKEIKYEASIQSICTLLVITATESETQAIRTYRGVLSTPHTFAALQSINTLRFPFNYY